MPKHKSEPNTTSYLQFSTGEPPLSVGATELAEQARYMLNWAKARQIFSYMGPGPWDRDLSAGYPQYVHINPDYDFPGDPYFSVITKSEEFSSVGHQLGGWLMPWRYQAGATISWTPDGGSPTTIWTAGADSHDDLNSVRFWKQPTERIKLYEGVVDNGVTDGGFSSHKLSYSGIMVSGVNIMTMPDRSLDAEHRLFDLEQFLAGRQVRGYSATRAGLGNLIGDIASVIYRTGRCMLQSGHPSGVCTSSTSYVNLRHDDSAFLVEPIGLLRGDDIACTPCIVAGAVGASGGNPAYVKFESIASSDSYEFTITSDTEDLYTAAGELNCYRFSEQVLISIKAPTDGAVYVRTFALWEGM